MKKIVFFTKNLKIGGMEKALITLLDNIDYQKYEVTLVLEQKEGELCNGVNKNVKIIDYKLATNKNILIRKCINFIKKMMFKCKNKNKFDCAINYATYSIWGSQMALISSKNTILFVHSDYYNVFKGDLAEIKEFFNNIRMQEFRKVIFVSKNARSNMIKIIPTMSKKSLALGNLIDYKNIERKSNEYIPEIDKNIINLLFLGRLEEESKNLSKLIEKVNNSQYKDLFKLYIIGTGPDEKRYKSEAESPNIIFLGELENPYPYLKECNYLVLTSRFEGFPMVYSEATLLDTGIITTIPVEDEQIKYDGDNIIKLDRHLDNFEEVISKIVDKNISIKIPQIDFENVNKAKVKEFYDLIEEKE